MQPSLSFVIIDSDRHSRNAIEDVLTAFGDVRVHGAADDFRDGLRIIQKTPPSIVILEARDIESGIEEVKYLLAKFPGSAVFITAHEKNPDWILRLIRAGASEYLTRPIVATELADAVNKVARIHDQRSGHVRNKGTAISVYNPSGGMGTTTIAVNLAATLAARGEKVALIDLNLFSGDIAAFLDLAPRYNLANVTAKTGQIDSNFLRSVIVPHSSGMHVLNGPAELGDADRIKPEQLQEVIGILQSIFTYTVIDTGGQLFGCNLATFGCSDHILFTTLLNIPALKNAKRYLASMDNEGVGADKVKLVVNRHVLKDDIKLADAEKILNTSAYQTVPNAYADAKTSINKGEPLVRCYPHSPVTKAMDELARQLVLDTAASGKTALQGGI